MSLDEATDQDVKKEVGGIPFIIEKKLDYEYDGIKIDYKKTLFKSGFTIKLKEAISQCSN